jgi:hypothetical protein
MMVSPGIRSRMALATVKPPMPESKIPNGLFAGEILRVIFKSNSFLQFHALRKNANRNECGQ